MALQDRAMRAFRGEAALFEEVEKDPAATNEALIIVAVTAVSLGIGSAVGPMVMGAPGGGVVRLVVSVIGALVGWAVFSFVAYFIGTKLFGADATWEEVLRTQEPCCQHPGVGPGVLWEAFVSRNAPVPGKTDDVLRQPAVRLCHCRL